MFIFIIIFTFQNFFERNRYQKLYGIKIYRVNILKMSCKWSYGIKLFISDFFYSKIILIFIYVVAYISSLLLFIAKKYSIVWMYHNVHIHSWDGHLDYPSILGLIYCEKWSINICIDIFVWTYVFFLIQFI